MGVEELLWHIFAIIGAIKLAWVLLPWIWWKLFCKIHLDNYKDGFFLVTGASDGIGKEIVRQLVKNHFKVIMVSRTLSKLEQLRDTLLEKYPGRTIEIVTADFSKSHNDPVNFYADLCGRISQYDISALINCVGVADFHTLMNEKYEDIENMLGVNIYPSTHLTHFLIPRFLERKKSKKLNSLVIDFSSTAEECIYPGSVVYSITKRYNAFMNEGLRFEYPEIEFACVKPGPVLTQLLLSNNGQKMPFKVETKDYVKALLSSLRTGVNHGHWKHTLMGILLRIWPYLVNIIGVRILMPIAVKNGLIR